MKRIISFVLVLVMMLSMVTFAGAATLYEYGRHIVTDMYGGTFTFSNADFGYGIRYYNEDGEYLVSPLVIVDDDSFVKYRAPHGIVKFGGNKKAEEGSAFYACGITRTHEGMYGKSVVIESAEKYALESVFKEAYEETLLDETLPLPEDDQLIEADDVFTEITEGAIEEEVLPTKPAIEAGMVSTDIIFGEVSEKYDDRDRIIFLHGEGGYLIAVMTETAAGAHSNMIVSDGPDIGNQTELFKFGRGYVNEEGILSYDYVIRNTSGERMSGSYALLTYHEKPHKVNGTSCQGVQVTPLELDIKKGGYVTGTLVSEYGELGSAVINLIRFDSEEERDAFYMQEGFEKTDHIYCPRYKVDNSAFALMKSNYGL